MWTWSKLAREPYRLFFPLGVLLALGGVGHWLLLGLRVIEAYRPAFHAMAQMQGFVSLFAYGFLMTMLPRRLGAPWVSPLEFGPAFAGPVVCTVAAWTGHLVVAQLSWCVSLVAVSVFVLRRQKKASRRAPVGFVWIPVAFVAGFLGVLFAGVGAVFQSDWWFLHRIGRDLVLQVMFIALVLGAGSLVLPLFTRNDPPKDDTNSMRDQAQRIVHVLAAVALLGSAWLRGRGAPAEAFFIRFVVIAYALWFSTQLWKRPTRPGATRWLVWYSAWALGVGYFMASVDVDHYKGWLHISFIGGFALMTLSVSTQLVLGHGGYEKLKDSYPRPVLAMGAALLAAVGARVFMEINLDQFYVWIAIASACFLSALFIWLGFVGSKLLKDSP